MHFILRIFLQGFQRFWKSRNRLISKGYQNDYAHNLAKEKFKTSLRVKYLKYQYDKKTPKFNR